MRDNARTGFWRSLFRFQGAARGTRRLQCTDADLDRTTGCRFRPVCHPCKLRRAEPASRRLRSLVSVSTASHARAGVREDRRADGEALHVRRGAPATRNPAMFCARRPEVRRDRLVIGRVGCRGPVGASPDLRADARRRSSSQGCRRRRRRRIASTTSPSSRTAALRDLAAPFLVRRHQPGLAQHRWPAAAGRRRTSATSRTCSGDVGRRLVGPEHPVELGFGRLAGARRRGTGRRRCGRAAASPRPARSAPDVELAPPPRRPGRGASRW